MADQEPKTELEPTPATTGEPAAGASPAPVVVAEPATAEPAGDPTVGETGVEVVSDPASTPDPVVAKPPKQDWKVARIARLTAQLDEYKNKEKEVPPAAPASDPVERLNAAAIESRARELAAQQVAFDKFNSACVETAQKGKELFTDFDARISDLRQLQGGDNDVQRQLAYNQLVAAAIETGAAPQILHTLGGDLDEAERILSLNPVKMAIELTRMVAKAPDVSVTRAPKPITPISGRGAQHTAIDPADAERADRLSTAEWMARRNKQVAAEAETRGRR